jgi:hypothetical protein
MYVFFVTLAAKCSFTSVNSAFCGFFADAQETASLSSQASNTNILNQTLNFKDRL